MRIDSSTINMGSARSYQASEVTVGRYRVTDYLTGVTLSGTSVGTMVSREKEDTYGEDQTSLKESVSDIWEWNNRFSTASYRVTWRSENSRTMMELKELTVRYIFELLFGSPKERRNRQLSQEARQTAADTQFVSNAKMIDYRRETWRTEWESTSFSTVGTVKTSDGREIHFNVEVGMSRAFQEYFSTELNLAAFQMCDPLVINLDTDAADFSDQKFFFDIDGDGAEDQVSMLEQGSGYLALDKNGDGVINDGKELFGTASGDGFRDLAQYDEDGNGWIDENDAVWSKLQIWCKDENGQDVLYRLADKGVGAICLQNVSTDFTLKGQDGISGRVRSTGIFLYENGSAGTIQHVDVAKYEGEA